MEFDWNERNEFRAVRVCVCEREREVVFYEREERRRDRLVK